MHAVELAVVIPTLDEEGSLAGCLDAVGDRGSFEIVVVDGGSTDLTRKIARRMGARVVRGPLGRGPQLNFGAASTDAKRLLFLHADCRLADGWLEAVTRALDDNRVSLACFRLHTVPAGAAQTSPARRWLLRVFDIRSRGLRLPYGDQGFAVRREVFERCGRFPEIPLMEDVAFAARCRRVGRIQRLPLEIRTIARRIERHPVKTALMLSTFPTLFRLGVAPETLARWYGTVR